jgi:hypothetical protein
VPIVKALLLILALVAIYSPGSFAQDSSNDVSTLQVTTAGQISQFDLDKERVVKFWLHKLLLSALYQDLITDSTLQEWQQQAAVPTRLYCRYSSRATLALPERPTLLFDEVLIPVQSISPRFLYVKRDDTVLRLAKYDPWVYVKLATEAGIPVHPSWLAVERGFW